MMSTTQTRTGHSLNKPTMASHLTAVQSTTSVEDDLLVTHFYLCKGITEKAEKLGSIGDLYGEAEDSVIYTAIFYSLILHQNEYEFCDDDKPGVFNYEVSEDLAASLWLLLSKQESSEMGTMEWWYPNVNEFRHLSKLLIRDWISGKLKCSDDVEAWLKEAKEKEPQKPAQEPIND